MDLKAAILWRTKTTWTRATIARDNMITNLHGVGLNLPGPERSINLRVLPAAARQARLALDLDIIAPSLSATGDEVGFVQVGAFDGSANDPIHDLVVRFGWRGVLVEPQPEAFDRLQQTYAGIDGLVFLNAAIGPERGRRPFYFVAGDEPGDPWWRGQIASFDRAHLTKHIRGDRRLLDRITSHEVEMLTLDDVFQRAPRPVDVLQVDAEGYDGQIVSSLNLDAHRPAVIRFEHKHLSVRDHQMALEHLLRGGYRFAVNEDDTIAMRHQRGRGMTATA